MKKSFLPALIPKALRKAFTTAQGLLQPSGGWLHIWDNYAGQWQQDVRIDTQSVLAFSAVFACLRLISTDIGKMRIKLVQNTPENPCVWREFPSAAFTPVLRKPNPHQTRIKFLEQWITQKLIHGKAYIFKTRDGRGVVVELRVLDSMLVEPLVSESGAVFYRLRTDRLAQLTEPEVIVPAREIIHDVHFTPDHPLIGVSPIQACGLAATQGLKIQQNSAKFFANMSRPGFILSAPGAIRDETAARIKAQWEAAYGGANYGRTAVLGDDLKPHAFSLSPEDSQLIEQLNWTSLDVCRAFGVPPYKIGVGPMPAYNNIEALDQAYYSQCLQELIECVELQLDEGLDLPANYGTELDLDGLLRMDTMTQVKVSSEEIKAGYLTPNEARARRNLEPVVGGDTPYMQQQNYALSDLAKRSEKEDPFATAGAGGRRAGDKPGSEPEPAEPEPTDENTDEPTDEDKAAGRHALEAMAQEILEKAA